MHMLLTSCIKSWANKVVLKHYEKQKRVHTQRKKIHHYYSSNTKLFTVVAKYLKYVMGRLPKDFLAMKKQKNPKQ